MGYDLPCSHSVSPGPMLLNEKHLDINLEGNPEVLSRTRDVHSAETGLFTLIRSGVVSLTLSGSVTGPPEHRDIHATITVLPIIPDTLVMVGPARVAVRTAVEKLNSAAPLTKGLNLAIESVNSDTAPHSSSEDEDLDPTPIAPIGESLLNEPGKLD